jgi:hypothetical protein
LIENNDVVVATPKTISPAERDVVFPPEDSFDVVFFDEAHHAPAVTWNTLIEAFKNSKVVLFTATPFRRDKKRIKASLVYHYSISNAIKDGIYRIVEYIPVNTSLDEERRDNLIAERAILKFNQELHTNNDVKVLIKTETIQHAEELKSIYNNLGLNVDTIHNDKTDNQNNDIIERCRNNQLKGIVCVGMIGEGLDIPELKIAVLHSIPRTLPFTIQFIGRVSRANDRQNGNAFLIADPNYVKGEVKKLYKYDRGWYDLIPSLVDRRVSGARFLEDRDFLSLNPYDINTKDIEPFFSIRVYSISENFEFNENLNNLPFDLELVLVEQENENEPLIIITSIDEELPWGKNLPLSYNRYDLHIFLVINDFLFEYTSSDYYCNKVKRALLVEGTYKRADYNIIKNGLSDTQGREYFMIGMANSTGVSKSNPKYKMYLGKEVQSALRISDGRIFSVGHALAKISDQETRGIALKNSRVWAVSRDSITVFKEWCNSIYQLITNRNGTDPIPQMEFLADTQSITELPGNPISILFDSNIFDSSITIIEIDSNQIRNPSPYVELVEYNENTLTILGKLIISEQTIDIQYSLSDPNYWCLISDSLVNIHMDFGNNEPFRGSLQQYLKEYPPLIVLSTGQTVKNNILYTPRIQSERFRRDLFISKVWDNTDVKKEADPPGTGYLFNVQQKAIEFIRPTLHQNDYLIIDDRKDEVADLVCFRLSEKIIEFYHCKYKVSDGRVPGANKLDITELIDQGIRNGNWIYSANLVTRLIERIQGNSILVQGTLAGLRELEHNFYPNQWSYKVVLVQPGIKKERVFRDNTITNIEELLCTLYDRTQGINAEFEVWGS